MTTPAITIPKKPTRASKTTGNRHRPSVPRQPSSGTKRGPTAKVAVNLSDAFAPVLPPLPNSLDSLLRSDREPSTETLTHPETEPFIFAAVGEGCHHNDIDAALRLPAGTTNAYVISDAEKITRLCLALEAAAVRIDSAARTVFCSVYGHPASGAARVALALGNALRCEAEGKRRLSESLGRRLQSLSEHRETQRRAAAQKKQAAAREAAKTAEEERRRCVRASIDATVGPGTLPPREIIAALGTPMTQEEFNNLEMEDHREAVRCANHSDQAGLMKLADEVRRRWLSRYDALEVL